MHGCIYGRMDKWIDEAMNGWMDGLIEQEKPFKGGWMDGSTDGWIDETTDGWMCGGIEGGPGGTVQSQFACVSLLLTTLFGIETATYRRFFLNHSVSLKTTMLFKVLTQGESHQENLVA